MKNLTITELKAKIKFGELAGGVHGIRLANKAREELKTRKKF
jgi:hypothetical protein